MPTSADEALETAERLVDVKAPRNPALERFGIALVHFYQDHSANGPAAGAPGGAETCWCGDQRAGTAGCRTAVYPRRGNKRL